jgi:DinB superfamily
VTVFRIQLKTMPDQATQTSIDSLKFPIGKFSFPKSVTVDQRNQWIAEIAELPSKLRAAVAGLSAEQLETPYRPDGWTVRQVVHHVPESHMNAYIRFKLALTEDEPTVKPYEEAEWAKTPDVAITPIETSLALLDVLHERWMNLLRGLTDADFERQFRHPQIGLIRLGGNTALYAWHGKHHTAHITSLRERMGW